MRQDGVGVRWGCRPRARLPHRIDGAAEQRRSGQQVHYDDCHLQRMAELEPRQEADLGLKKFGHAGLYYRVLSSALVYRHSLALDEDLHRVKE